MRVTPCWVLLIAGVALAQDGRQDFARRCSVCHGADGHGTERGPNLAKSRQVRSRSLDELRAVISGGIPAGARPAFVRSLSGPAAEANAPGDRAAGERFFFGNGGCAGCHMALGRGKAVGPDLSAVGREMTLDELDEAVRQPSAKIKPGYQVVNVRLRDGSALRGFARNRSRYNLQLQDLTGQFHSLKEEQIAELTVEPKSLMPAPQCSAAECRDLLAFLSSLTGVTVGMKAAPMA